MAISNLSTGLRPGVCTSTTRPTAPFEGQMIYETDTNRVLLYEGAAWVMIADTDTPPGLELVKTQTVSAGSTEVEVTSAFSSTYDNYRVLWSGLTVTSGTAYLRIRFGTDNNHYWSLLYSPYNSTFSNLNGAGDTHIKYIDGTLSRFDGGCDVIAPFLSANTRISATQYADGGASGVTIGYQANSNSYTSIRLSPSASSFSSGTIRVYGYRNS